MEKLIRTLNQINWDFSDYNSLKFPIDINSIPWYPATLPPPIPKFLIALLSKENDIVFDPFGGKGTVGVEAIKQNRRFYYNDLNPFAADITKDIINILKGCCLDRNHVLKLVELDTETLKSIRVRFVKEDVYEGKNEEIINKYYAYQLSIDIDVLGLSRELPYWYHIDTLNELVCIYKLLESNHDTYSYYIRKVAFVSMLKEVCSQRGHFTYITDNCRPSKITYFDAFTAYLAMLKRINDSAADFIKQFHTTNSTGNLFDIINNSYINCGDSRRLDWIENNSIDLVITSPPYLCAQDYVKTMRLINLFFPEERFKDLTEKEIGARARRKGRAAEVVQSFYDDMDNVLNEVSRILKKDKYFCLVIGQGKGKITKEYDTINDISTMAITKHSFEKVFQTTRRINYKAVRIGGVDSEEIIIFRKIN